MTLDTFNFVLIAIFSGFLLIIVGLVVLILSQGYKQLRLPKFNMQRRQFLIYGGVSIVGILIGGLAIKQQRDNAVVICNGWILKESELKSDVCEPIPFN